MTKIILVAQTHMRRSKEPLDGASGRRLAALAGLDLTDFLDRFERVNLLAANGDAFDIRAARDRADKMRVKWGGRKVVLLGRGVAAAFRLVPEDYQWFKPLEIPPGIEVAVMPHPSGISHWWNDDNNVQSARDFMLRLKLGFVGSQKPNGREKFTVDEIAAALEAGRGVNSWAAAALAEETGKNCVPQTIANYIARYPQLGEIGRAQVGRLVDTAKRNIIRDIEDGGVDSSWKLMRSTVGVGSGFELVVHARVNGHVKHDHRHAHLHAKLSDVGLDLSRYSTEQLAAIEDFAGVFSGGDDDGNLGGKGG